MKSVFVCQKCGYQSPKWLGRCPDCGEWNSLIEEVSEPVSAHSSEYSSTPPQNWREIGVDKELRFSTEIEEFDRILGGGIVRGSVVLVGGEPGIGKSTLLLQISNLLSKKQRVLYITGEESVSQTKLRGERLKIEAEELFVVSETNLNLVVDYIKKFSPQIVIIDSIQTLYKEELSSAPGSVSQIKECTAQLTLLAKKEGISMFLIGQVTKEGYLAGPRVLEHIVDVVLYFEGDKYYNYRILRAIKNRFGSTNEIGVFEMSERGLLPIPNPSRLFLQNREERNPGSSVVCPMEGTRPLLVEIQALVTPTHFGIPTRKSSGLDYNRCLLILAVLEKKIGLKLQMQDIFINVVGGIKVVEPAVDLGIALAVVSNFRNILVRKNYLFIGELGLGGEIRRVPQLSRRINEGEKLGFEYCVIPRSNLKSHFKNIEVIEVKDIQEAINVGLER
ncbi:MAG: DNA repair protein RadA [Candidatus Omnitrophica bacterium 4484_213]|nr:MAG: DNA repair protein RadA [Candidatus Omnitrophica bacterium 4484_213]